MRFNLQVAEDGRRRRRPVGRRRDRALAAVAVALAAFAVAAALEAAHTFPVARRLDVYLEWIARGSPLAEADLERWLTEFPAGALTGQQRQRLEDVVLAWPDEALRRADQVLVGECRLAQPSPLAPYGIELSLLRRRPEPS